MKAINTLFSKVYAAGEFKLLYHARFEWRRQEIFTTQGKKGLKDARQGTILKGHGNDPVCKTSVSEKKILYHTTLNKMTVG